MNKYSSRTWFVVGLLAGFLACYALLKIVGYTVVSQKDLAQQQKTIVELQQENLELTEDLFKPQILAESGVFGGELPYDESADARSRLVASRADALKSKKFLMVTFGANWCMDCRNLHRTLNSAEVSAYTGGLFEFVNVNIGKFNENLDVAAELGVTLKRGIPVAVFFDPDGNLIGTTNEGQLEPARRYSSKQILRFVKDIAEESRIMAPDAVRK